MCQSELEIKPEDLFCATTKLASIYPRELELQSHMDNVPRPVQEAGAFVNPVAAPKPKQLLWSTDCAQKLGFRPDADSSTLIALVSGNKQFVDYPPFAMNYAGHQFGHWAGQLGDGRAINIAELNTAAGVQALQLKGAGPTAFSRRGDGFAVLRSSIREFLCSEAMHWLGVPTTRALSLCLRGDQVVRDMFYDGRAALEPSAVVCRVAPSFIRFGHFELAASRGDKPQLKALITLVIKHYFPQLLPSKRAGELHLDDQLIASFFQTVMVSTAELIAHWQSLGFTHGVLNTDNMSIHGLTLDYGPYGWLEPYELDWTPNTTDAQGLRYAFGQQPEIGLWNCWRLANALARVMDNASALSDSLSQFQGFFQHFLREKRAAKLGLLTLSDALNQQLEALLIDCKLDMTLFFRGLSQVQTSHDVVKLVNNTRYLTQSVEQDQAVLQFAHQYCAQITTQATANRAQSMNLVNPKYVLRNWLAYNAIEQAEQGDYTALNQLYSLIQKPFDEQSTMSHFAVKRPDWAAEQAGCAMLSCSS